MVVSTNPLWWEAVLGREPISRWLSRWQHRGRLTLDGETAIIYITAEVIETFLMIAECDNEGFMDFIQKCKSSTIIQQKNKKNPRTTKKTQQQPYNTNKTKQNKTKNPNKQNKQTNKNEKKTKLKQKKQTQTIKTSTIYTGFFNGFKNRFPLCYFSVSANAWKPLHIYTTWQSTTFQFHKILFGTLIEKSSPCGGSGFPLFRYLIGPLPYVWRHITVNKMCWARR